MRLFSRLISESGYVLDGRSFGPANTVVGPSLLLQHQRGAHDRASAGRAGWERRQPGPGEKGMRMLWYGSPGVWGWAFGLGSILFWVLVVAAVVALVGLSLRGGRRPDPPHRGDASGPGPYGGPGPPAGHMSPEQILADRFAHGEINEEEFHHRMAVLRDEGQPPGPETTPTWRDLAAPAAQ
jgi:putative membrane protein